tara:strand:- start:243 stop:467 length:225 start_codon:yes stop_codon:yes gene_type:complete
MTKFIETSASRETSPELLAAILRCAGDDEARAEQVWADGPTGAELVAIVEIVTQNGVYPTTDFYWGDAGTSWAE